MISSLQETSRVDTLVARVSRLSAAQWLRLLPCTAAVAATAAIALVSIKVWRQPAFPYSSIVIAWSLAAVAAAAVFALGSRWAPARSGDRLTPWLAALHLGLLCAVGAVFLLVKPVAEDDVPAWTWTFGYLNKRWLVGLYYVAIFTVAVFPVAIERWRSGLGRTRGSVTVEWTGASHDSPPRRRNVVAGAIAALALVWYFTGPPWHLERHHRPIDWHEQIHLDGIQAIDKGYLPYIGPASAMYGPGSQLLMYRIMRARGFDLVGFRTAWAAFEVGAFAIFAVAVSCWLGAAAAVASVLLAVAYSSFSFYYTTADGTLAGYYGWANPLRYLPTLIVVCGLALIARDDGTSQRRRQWTSTALGVGYGIGAWLAQENLAATVTSGALTLLLLWLTRTARAGTVVGICALVALGFSAVAAPVLALYAAHGALGEFLRNYFLQPHAVAMGYSNMWWPPQDRVSPSYYLALPFLLGIAVCTVWQVRSFRLAPLTRRRTLLLALVCVQLAAYQTALLRSDSVHLMNTMIALPVLLAVGAIEIPLAATRTAPGRIAVTGVFVLASALMVPNLVSPDGWRNRLLAPVARFAGRAAATTDTAHGARSIAVQRATSALADEPLLASGSGLTMRDFLAFADDLHELVGTRRTYVASLDWRVWTGLVYFMADLTPAPYPLNRESMAINGPLRETIVDHIRTHPDDYQCFVALSLTTPEAKAFLQAHPSAARYERLLPTVDGSRPSVVNVLIADLPRR